MSRLDLTAVLSPVRSWVDASLTKSICPPRLGLPGRLPEAPGGAVPSNSTALSAGIGGAWRC